MTYRVIYAQSFIDDIDRQVAYLREQQVAVSAIEGWFNKLFLQIDSLNSFQGDIQRMMPKLKQSVARFAN